MNVARPVPADVEHSGESFSLVVAHRKLEDIRRLIIVSKSILKTGVPELVYWSGNTKYVPIVRILQESHQAQWSGTPSSQLNEC